MSAVRFGSMPLFGALGVLFGYALYFQIEPLIHDQDREAAGSLIIGLMAAGALGALWKWIRQIIDGGAQRLLPAISSVLGVRGAVDGVPFRVPISTGFLGGCSTRRA